MKDSNDDTLFNLPAKPLSVTLETVKLLEESRVKKFIGPLIMKAHKMDAQRIAVLSWNSEEATRATAKILASSLTEQTGRKCATVIVEGIRFSCESFESYTQFTLAETEKAVTSKKVHSFLSEMDENFQFQILSGPNICDWDNTADPKCKIALSADAHILIAPSEGFTHEATKKIEAFVKRYKLKWLGMITYDRGGS